MVSPVSYFLLVFDRRKRKLIGDVEEFAEAEPAMRARFRRESAGDGDVEVVVLGAASRKALENTHSRYFGPGRELTPA
jgi:hypothetical protein